jgi:hypothetical protein
LVIATLDDQQYLDRLRASIPLEVEHEDPHTQLREFSQLLLVFPFVMLIIFGCSQLALFTSSNPTIAEASSSLSAEYGPWLYIPITGLRSGIVDEIRMDSENPVDVYNDPVVVSSIWVDEDQPPVIVAQVPPTEESNSTEGPDGGGASSEDDPPATEDSVVIEEPSPTIEPSPTNAQPPWPTATKLPISTDDPANTTTPIPTIPGDPISTPTDTPTDIPTQAPTSTSIPTDTPTPTNTAPVTDTPTSPPPPPDYCANIQYKKVSVNKQRSSPNRLWKFYINVYNNNSISMFLTSYQVSWTNDSDLHLNRAKAIPNPDTGTRVTLGKSKSSSPRGNCTDCPVEFVPQPVTFDAEIYNMYCNDYPCNESDPRNDIPPGTYSFTATGVFTFYPPGGGSVSCPFSKSASVSHP